MFDFTESAFYGVAEICVCVWKFLRGSLIALIGRWRKKEVSSVCPEAAGCLWSWEFFGVGSAMFGKVGYACRERW